MNELEDDSVQSQLFADASPGDWAGDLLMDLELPVSIRFGRVRISLSEALDLESGSVLELDSRVDDPVEVVVNNKVVALGNLMVVDGYYGVEITSMPGSRGAVTVEQRLPIGSESRGVNGGQAPLRTGFSSGVGGTEIP